MIDLPDVSICATPGCGRFIFWNDYGYIHREGWADCFRQLPTGGFEHILVIGKRQFASPLELEVLEIKVPA